MSKMKYLSLCVLLLSLYSEQRCEDSVKEEFNIVPLWYDGMTWEQFLKIRNSLKRKELCKYVDKIEQQLMAKDAGLVVPKTYLASREKIPFIDIISGMKSYVAKLSHLSFSQGLIIVKNGIDLITCSPITPEHVQERIFASLSEKPRDVESWALHHVEPGFIIQEYIPQRMEVKIQTIWGKVVIGEWRGGEECGMTTAIFGRYDRDGKLADGTREAPQWWPKAVAAAELMAKGTDALRIDFLIKDDELLLNELEIWPESNWSSMKTMLEDRLNEGYRDIKLR